ncbi:MAG: hypothetical protein AB7E79_02155 [Rhodospirillaceae bacterium]
MAKNKEPKKAARKTKPSGDAATSQAGDDPQARRRVALLRHKLTRAMDDPLMRDQIVKAIRTMMTEGK